MLRYSRHLIMPEVGMEGQLKIKQAKVLCVGTGGLGAPLGALSGRRRRGPDRPGRFRRRGFHESAAAGHSSAPATWAEPKTLAAANRLRDLNPDIRIDTFETA